MACGIATLKILQKTDPYAQLEAVTTRLVAGLSAAARDAGIEHHCAQVGSMFTLFFNPDRVTNMTVSGKNDTQRFASYFRGMLDRGVYLPCSQFEANFVSTAHSEKDIDATISAARDVLTGRSFLR